MGEKRRFDRVTCDENVFAVIDGSLFTAKLQNISLTGALIEFEDNVTLQHDDILDITFPLNNADIELQFGSKVRHVKSNIVGVKFIRIDLDTMTHLRSLIEARTADLEQVQNEFGYLG